MLNWYVRHDDILHFNPNHDPKNGQFTSKGINRLKYMNPDGTLTKKGQKKYGKARERADREIDYINKYGTSRKQKRKLLIIGPTLGNGVGFYYTKWYQDAAKIALKKAEKRYDYEYIKKLTDAINGKTSKE